jgi:threonine/homoserine/homoserine lactone efflux protein
VALTGAMTPGPLLTYTIIKSARTSKRGYLMGLWIIIGHAILEMGIIILLLLGFSFILNNIIVIRIIGIVALPLSGKGLENPVIGGIMVSMSNPYWWIWWATIGLAFMIQFEISFREWPNLIAFFLGHEAGDLIWYLIVSTFAFFGLRRLNKKAYYGILVFCAIFMIVFGIYLGISPFFHDL